MRSYCLCQISDSFVTFAIQMNQEYDYIIAGAGLAGLSLAIRLAEPAYRHKKVLLIDKSSKKENDRTWSFWMKESDRRYASIYLKSWSRLRFQASGVDKIFETSPYAYHTIRGIDFYRHAFDIIGEAQHITFLQGDVDAIGSDDDGVWVSTGGRTISAAYVFDSIVRKFPEGDKLFVWQHFMGWEITCDQPVFDDEVATFMDFRIDQADDTRFVYVLPFSRQKALVEATLFSKEIAEEHTYEEILGRYLKTHYPDTAYKIDNVEIGAIPMTTGAFGEGGKRIIPIGTNNGTVKASSGYAFTRIQEECDELVAHIDRGIYTPIKRKKRFLAYDRTLLNILITHKLKGDAVFAEMFRHNDPRLILKFLDERTSLWEEIQFFKTLPIWPFTKAFVIEQYLNLTKEKQL